MKIKLSNIKAQSGATLIIVLFILLLVTIVGVLAIRVSITSLNIATNSQISQLLVQTADTPLNQFSGTDLSNIDNLSGIIGYAINENLVEPGKEFVFCYRPTSNEKFGAAFNVTALRPPSTSDNANTKSTLVDGGDAGFCDLRTDFGSGRQAVVTQVSVKIPTDIKSNIPGEDLSRGTNLSQGSILPKNIVAQQRVRITTTSILPAYSTTDIQTVKNDCIGSSSTSGYINDNADTALDGKRTVADCLAGYGIPVSSQVQEYTLATVFEQIQAAGT